MTRTFDIVVYGATGFVGRQTAQYFAKHADQKLRWAIAGRSAEKLESLKKSLASVSTFAANNIGVIVADANDAKALGELAGQASVVLSTAGPFDLFGSKLVAACVKHGTHYVDITGETPWVKKMIDRHHKQAEKDGTRIIPGCGFDSVPSDLGAWMVAAAMMEKYGEPCESVKACYSIRGGLNGGTFASIMNIMASEQAGAFAEPFLLNPANTKPRDQAAHADPIAPHRDADFKSWLGPFFMGPINTRVVRRTVALCEKLPGTPYAAHFHYQEYLRFGRGMTAAVAAASMSMGAGVGQAAMRFGPVRRVAKAIAPAPGQGPSERSMDRGSFRCELIGKSASGRVVRLTIADQGDPGNRATTKFVCEAALAILALTNLPKKKLKPPTASSAAQGAILAGGVLTPASALGNVLAERLMAAGMTFDVRF